MTHTALAEINKYHDIGVPNNKTILEIGVGYGDTLRELKYHRNKVFGCDISQVALDNIKDDVDGVLLTENLKEAEPVDLAISHLTFQHNYEEEVARMIDDVNLKDDGIFSFQFASLNPEKTVLSELIINDINKSMLYFYSCDKMRSLIELTNKEYVSQTGPYWFPDPFSFEWYVFRVKNKS